MMATLNSLPHELILAIVDHVTPQCLYNLSLVSRHLHELTLEHLYATFSGEYRFLFLRTIATASLRRQRNLAKLVKYVEWSTNPFYKRTESSYSMGYKWEIAEAYRNLDPMLRGGGHPLDVDFTLYERREPIDQHWYFELFLAFLPNVTELNVFGTWQWDDHNYWFTHTVAPLKKVVLDGPLRIENIHPLLMVPSLRSLELREVIVIRQEAGGIFPWDLPERRIELAEASSGLEELRLTQSYIGAPALITVTNTIRALKSFSYMHVRHSLSLGAINFSCPGLASALNRHKSSLEHFEFCLKLNSNSMSFTEVSDLENLDPYDGGRLSDPDPAWW
jgi:hypothetical protein